MIHAETRAESEKAHDKCVRQFERLYPKAMAALRWEWERMVTLYELPERALGPHADGETSSNHRSLPSDSARRAQNAK
jgi:hypothetical protein